MTFRDNNKEVGALWKDPYTDKITLSINEETTGWINAYPNLRKKQIIEGAIERGEEYPINADKMPDYILFKYTKE